MQENRVYQGDLFFAGLAPYKTMFLGHYDVYFSKTMDWVKWDKEIYQTTLLHQTKQLLQKKCDKDEILQEVLKVK